MHRSLVFLAASLLLPAAAAAMPDGISGYSRPTRPA